MSKNIPPRPRTQRQKDRDALEAVRDQIWEANWLEGERAKSNQLWADYHAMGGCQAYLRDAEVALEEARAVQAARDARLANTVAEAVAESFIDLDP